MNIEAFKNENHMTNHVSSTL